MTSLLSDFLASGTFRRAIAALVAVALPVINSKLGLNIPSEQVIAAITAAVGYIAQSMLNEVHARTAGANAAAKVASVEDAANVFADAKPTPVNTVPPVVAPVKVEE